MNTRRPFAFTLVEMIIVVLIMVLLVSLLAPSLGRARTSARSTVCASNLHQIGLAAQARQNQRVFSNTPSITCSIADLRPFISDRRVFICPEGYPFASGTGVELAGQLAIYSNDAHTPANFLFYADLAPNDYCWQTVVASNTFYLNFEDQQQGQLGGDHSFYNFYVRVMVDDTGTIASVTSLSASPSDDTRPPTEDPSHPGGPGTGISGGYSFDLVSLPNHNIIRAPFNDGDPNPASVTYTPESYGMSTIYPGAMAQNGIAVLDYNLLSASVAGYGRGSGSEFTNGLTRPAVPAIPPAAAIPAYRGFNRHFGRFNALFSDGSVTTLIDPSIVNPDNGPSTRQQWWGERTTVVGP